MRSHPEELRLALLGALLREREREITDTLVELLISTVHRVAARAEKKVTKITWGLSPERLSTQLETTTSTLASGSGICSR